MIVFLVTRSACSTLTRFFTSWGSGLAPRVTLAYYEELAALGGLPGAATYVFTDLERLTPAGLRLTAELADTLAEAPGPPRILNHPRTVVRRYELLLALHERGVNPFRAHRALRLPADVRFPAFLRSEHEHRVRSPLLWSTKDVTRRLEREAAKGHDLEPFLLIEYQDVADADGMFHRYISHVIGDAVIPGFLAFSSDWVVKGGPFLDGERLERQRASVLSHAHDSFLREIAEFAGVGYGRFDYAAVDGRVCIWELNTNPTLLLRPEVHSPFALEQVRPVAARLIDALERLDAAGEERRRVHFHVPAEALVVRRVRPRAAPGRRNRRARST
jgi:hypothetical protein